MKDKLGDRIKEQYEDRTRFFLPRRTYTIIRLDGKAFHTFTKNFEKPFDISFVTIMNETAQYLCKNIQGCKFGYVQSDEISLLLTDFDKITTDSYFNGNIQKIVSISASMATSKFNALYSDDEPTLALFDSRVFTIPDKEEVINYFIWRQKDATRNSIQMVAQSLYSHKELMNKNQEQLQELIFQKGKNWNDYPAGLKRGRSIIKKEYKMKDDTIRTRWIIDNPPIFTQDREYVIKGI